MLKKFIKIFIKVISIVLILLSLFVIKYVYDSNNQYSKIESVNSELKGSWLGDVIGGIIDSILGGGSGSGSGNNGSSKPVHTHKYSATVIQKGNPDCAEYTITEYMGTELEFCYFHLVGGPEPPRTKYGCGKWTRHETYNRNADNITELIEFLKAVQKGENYGGYRRAYRYGIFE